MEGFDAGGWRGLYPRNRAGAGAPGQARACARKVGIMASTFNGNQKLLEQKLTAAGLYHGSIRPTMNECAKIMTRLHHYNLDHIRNNYRTSMPDGKRPPELIALENASRELLNYLKALGLVADTKKCEKKTTDGAHQNAASPMAALARILEQHESGDDP